jgi:hypothetical protein
MRMRMGIQPALEPVAGAGYAPHRARHAGRKAAASVHGEMPHLMGISRGTRFSAVIVI